VDAVPHGGFYVIELFNLKESFSAIPRGETETVVNFFGSFAMVGSQMRENLPEHQCCQT
jgi:hypothetical protein